jgi:hypothetical protein
MPELAPVQFILERRRPRDGQEEVSVFTLTVLGPKEADLG